jgi:hypothetical protein
MRVKQISIEKNFQREAVSYTHIPELLEKAPA